MTNTKKVGISRNLFYVNYRAFFFFFFLRKATEKQKIDTKSRKQVTKKKKDTQDTRNSKVTSERTEYHPESSSTRRPITEDLRSDSTSSIEGNYIMECIYISIKTNE
jgi:hypothetical protein